MYYYYYYLSSVGEALVKIENQKKKTCFFFTENEP